MTAVKAGDVERAVANRPAGIDVLLFYGPDAGRVSERARAAARAFVPDPEDGFQLIRLDGDALADEPARLVEEATTIGMFGGRRALWVRAGSRSVAPAVAACLDGPLVDTLIVVEAGDLGRTAPLRVLCEGSRRAYALPCYADEARDLGTVVTETLATHGLTIGREAREYLLQQLGRDRLASRGEVEKLALYARGQASVTIEDIDAAVSDASNASVDEVLDAAFGGQPAALGTGLSRLAALGTTTGTVAIMALRHAIALVAARDRFEASGEDLEAALRPWRGLHFKRKDAVARQVRRWPSGRLISVVAQLQAAVLDGRRSAALADQVTAATLFRIAEIARRSG